MSAEGARKAFYDELASLRYRPDKLDPTEVARKALRAGLNAREALLAIQNQMAFIEMRTGELADALGLFISTVCEKQKAPRILEYTLSTSLLTSRLADNQGDYELTYISPDPKVGEILRVLVGEKSSAILRSESDLPAESTFDVIICQPPLGQRPRANERADGFGGVVVHALAPMLADAGTLYWITGRGLLFTGRGKATLSRLEGDGLHVAGVIDVAPGALPGSMIEAAVVALRREVPARKFVGGLHDLETAEPMASAFLAGPTKKGGPSWVWLDADDERTFSDVEQDRLLRQLVPRGRHTPMTLGSLLASEGVERADKPLDAEEPAETFLFIPEYAASRVTADMESQTVKPKAVYRLAIDPAKANPRFLAQLLNSSYGRHARAAAALGATIKRTSVASLLSLKLPIPDLATQDRIARIDSDIALLEAAFRDMQTTLDRDWTALSDVADKIDGFKSVIDLNRQIADWWRELPYPLATIYRRYQVSTEPKERLDTILHFFEMAAVYLATIGTSHVKAMRADWQEVLAKWLHPAGGAGVERADFGFWMHLAGASLKDVSRIASDKELRKKAIELAGLELVEVAGKIGPLGKATEALDLPRRHRNSWKGHGGLVKASNAARLDGELQQSIRGLYEVTASTFRRFFLVRPGLADVSDTGYKYQVEKLAGSDPTFKKETIELSRPATSRVLAFWMQDARTICRALPFFRLGAPQEPQETSFYVFNRVENGDFRWISYQEAREQEIIAPDEELQDLISLPREAE